MLARLGERIARIFRATAPDPFVIAILLTALTFILAITVAGSTPKALVGYWSSDSGVWRFLSFGMQMCLILVTGHALASSPPVARFLTSIASWPKSAAQAAAMVALVAGLFSVLNWGLGLIAGALLARRVGVAMEAKGVKAHYPLLAAAGYTGLIMWHGGFSGTAPLKVSTTKEIVDIFGAEPPISAMPLTQTILSPLNLIVTGGLLILVPVVMAMLCPKDESAIEPASSFVSDEPTTTPESRSKKAALPRLLEDTPIVSLALVLLIGAWAWTYYFPREGPSGIGSLTPNTVNLTMLMLGLLLHGTPARYVAAVDDAVRGCAGIILQFPLYAGIMGMMHESGLTRIIADQFIALGGGTESGLAVMTFFSAGLVNLFVPSGGGQWAIQGPIAMQAAVDAGLENPSRLVMAVAYGDEWTNMLQPFWALPLLGITRVKARDIVGYTAVLMVIAGLWMTLCLILI